MHARETQRHPIASIVFSIISSFAFSKILSSADFFIVCPLKNCLRQNYRLPTTFAANCTRANIATSPSAAARPASTLASKLFHTLRIENSSIRLAVCRTFYNGSSTVFFVCCSSGFSTWQIPLALYNDIAEKRGLAGVFVCSFGGRFKNYCTCGVWSRAVFFLCSGVYDCNRSRVTNKNCLSLFILFHFCTPL